MAKAERLTRRVPEFAANPYAVPCPRCGAFRTMACGRLTRNGYREFLRPHAERMTLAVAAQRAANRRYWAGLRDRGRAPSDPRNSE